MKPYRKWTAWAMLAVIAIVSIPACLGKKDVPPDADLAGNRSVTTAAGPFGKYDPPITVSVAALIDQSTTFREGHRTHKQHQLRVHGR